MKLTTFNLIFAKYDTFEQMCHNQSKQKQTFASLLLSIANALTIYASTCNLRTSFCEHLIVKLTNKHGNRMPTEREHSVFCKLLCLVCVVCQVMFFLLSQVNATNSIKIAKQIEQNSQSQLNCHAVNAQMQAYEMTNTIFAATSCLAVKTLIALNDSILCLQNRTKRFVMLSNAMQSTATKSASIGFKTIADSLSISSSTTSN